MSKIQKRRTDSALDLLLKEGASGKKVNIDKAVVSTTHRLIREKITFTRAVNAANISSEYEQSGFVVLQPLNEIAAKRRMSGKSQKKIHKRKVNKMKKL